MIFFSIKYFNILNDLDVHEGFDEVESLSDCLWFKQIIADTCEHQQLIMTGQVQQMLRNSQEVAHI